MDGAADGRTTHDSNHARLTVPATWKSRLRRSTSFPDNTPPTVTIASLSNGQLLSQTTVITGTATDNINGSGVAKVLVGINGSPITAATYFTSAAAWAYTWTLPANQNGITYTINISASDKAKNASAVISRIVRVDNVSPTVTMVPFGQLTVTTRLSSPSHGVGAMA